jgi:hypothetical protein
MVENNNEIKLMMKFDPYKKNDFNSIGSWELVMSYNCITNEPIQPLDFKEIKDNPN